jgi:hypothetical protein
MTYISLLEGRDESLDKWFQTLQWEVSLQFQVFKVHEDKETRKLRSSGFSSDKFLRKFRDNLSVASSKVKNPKGKRASAKPDKPRKSVNWGRRFERSASRRPPVC